MLRKLILLMAVMVLCALPAIGETVPCSPLPDDENLRTSLTLCPNTYFLDNPIVLASDGIVLDCQGSRLIPAGEFPPIQAIVVKGRESIVKDCFVKGFPIGIFVEGEYSQTLGNTIQNAETGIHVRTNKASVLRNTLIEIDGIGIRIDASSEVIIAENKVVPSGVRQDPTGLLLANSTNSDVNVNDLEAENSLCVVGSSYNNIKHNKVLTDDFCMPDLKSSDQETLNAALAELQKLLSTNKFVLNQLKNGSVILTVNSVPKECIPEGNKTWSDLPPAVQQSCKEWMEDVMFYVDSKKPKDSTPGVIPRLGISMTLLWVAIAGIIILLIIFILVLRRR